MKTNLHVKPQNFGPSNKGFTIVIVVWVSWCLGYCVLCVCTVSKLLAGNENQQRPSNKLRCGGLLKLTMWFTSFWYISVSLWELRACWVHRCSDWTSSCQICVETVEMCLVAVVVVSANDTSCDFLSHADVSRRRWTTDVDLTLMCCL